MMVTVMYTIQMMITMVVKIALTLKKMVVTLHLHGDDDYDSDGTPDDCDDDADNDGSDQMM